jgi:hypothetical protein
MCHGIVPTGLLVSNVDRAPGLPSGAFLSLRYAAADGNPQRVATPFLCQPGNFGGKQLYSIPAS